LKKLRVFIVSGDKSGGTTITYSLGIKGFLHLIDDINLGICGFQSHCLNVNLFLSEPLAVVVDSITIDLPGTIAVEASIAGNLPMGLQGDILKSLRIPLAVIDNEFRYLWLNREMARL
jgi:hypothetical protein